MPKRHWPRPMTTWSHDGTSGRFQGPASGLAEWRSFIMWARMPNNTWAPAIIKTLTPNLTCRFQGISATQIVQEDLKGPASVVDTLTTNGAHAKSNHGQDESKRLQITMPRIKRRFLFENLAIRSDVATVDGKQRSKRNKESPRKNHESATVLLRVDQ